MIFEINPHLSGTTPIRAMSDVNEVIAVIKILTGAESENEYKEKEIVFIRYSENHYIPWDKYRTYSK